MRAALVGCGAAAVDRDCSTLLLLHSSANWCRIRGPGLPTCSYASTGVCMSRWLLFLMSVGSTVDTRMCFVVCRQVQASGARIVWERTQAWVTAAAQHAPATTEALLHSFICSTAVVGTQTDTFLHTLSRSMSVGTAGGFSRAESPLPNGNLSALANGHVAASHQLQQRQQHAAAGAPQSADSLLFPSSSSREGFHASQAAFRRAADLLQICGAARTKQQAAGADGAYEGTLAFARKLHYSGAVAGLMQGSAEEEDVMGTMESDTTAGTARRQQVAEQVRGH
jgi:hypothetical protein